jgi:hypothetical protein
MMSFYERMKAINLVPIPSITAKVKSACGVSGYVEGGRVARELAASIAEEADNVIAKLQAEVARLSDSLAKSGGQIPPLSVSTEGN